MSFIAFIGFYKNHFPKDRRLSLWLKGSHLELLFITFLSFSKQNASILKDWDNFVQKRKQLSLFIIHKGDKSHCFHFIYVIYTEEIVPLKSPGFFIWSSGFLSFFANISMFVIPQGWQVGVNGKNLLIIFAKRLYHRCLTGF